MRADVSELVLAHLDTLWRKLATANRVKLVELAAPDHHRDTTSSNGSGRHQRAGNRDAVSIRGARRPLRPHRAQQDQSSR